MPKEAYATSQVREVRFSRSEVVGIVLENFRARAETPYDFDYERPLVIFGDNGEIIFRFVQSEISREKEPRHIHFKPLEK